MSSTSQTSGTSGQTSLQTLLSTLTLILHEPTYVFLTIPSSSPSQQPPNNSTPSSTLNLPVPLSDILLLFHEPEGITLVITQSDADSRNLAYEYPCRMITCNVHSSLEAVGFMAVLATRLAEAGMSVNPVSGFFHDHLFVPVEKAEEAVRVLERVRDEAEAALG